MFEIAKILFKHFTIGLDVEEYLKLNEWRNTTSRHEELYQKIASYTFWKTALSDEHRRLEDEQWNILLQKIRTIKVRRRNLLLKRCVAVVIPFIVVFFVFWNKDSVENPEKKLCVQNELQYSSPLAIIRFADNSSFVVEKDSSFQLKQKGVVLKNTLDTLIVCCMNAETSNESYQIEVPIGGNYITRLEDGSVIHMDAASKLIVPSHFDNNFREVELYGHAYFIITPDPSRPFIVRTNGTTIRVLGTEFDLNAYNKNALKTTLIKGKVEVIHSEKQILLKPEQQATVNERGEIVVKNVDIYPVIAWKDQRIVFVNETLEIIMKSLKRWYNIEYIFMSKTLKNERFTLDIDKYKSVDFVLASIAKTGKIKFIINGKQVLIQEK